MIRNKSADEVGEVLNRIGRINKGEDGLVAIEEIEEYMERQKQIEDGKESTSVLDLCRYASLRKVFIPYALLGFFTELVYFAYSTMIDYIGFGAALNQILITSIEILAFPLLVLLSNRVPRKKSALIIFSANLVLFIGLYILKIPFNCHNCLEVYVQMGLLLATRLLFVFQIAIFSLSGVELFPVSVRSIAYGLVGLVGALGDFLSQVLFLGAYELGINPFLMLAGVFVLMIWCYVFLPETLGVNSRDQVEEVVDEKRRND